MSKSNGNRPSRFLRLTRGLPPPNTAAAKRLLMEAQAAGVPILKVPGAQARLESIGMNIGFNPDKDKGAANPMIFIEMSRPTTILNMPLAQAFRFAKTFLDAIKKCEEVVAQIKVCPACGKTLIYHERDLQPDGSMKLTCPDPSKLEPTQEEPPAAEDPPFSPGVEG